MKWVLVKSTELLFGWGDPLARYFALGAFTHAGLFTHRFAANPILARLANPTFERFGRLGADHTFFIRVTHGRHFTEIYQIANYSVQDFYLLGIFQNHFQTELGMIFDLSGDLDFFIFKIFRCQLVFFKELDRARKNYR
jgi:hypothetical protein